MMFARRHYVIDPLDPRIAGACAPSLGREAARHSRPQSHRRDGGAFTLIELLTVVAIIGILSTLIMSAMSKARTKANQVVCRGNLRQISYAVEMYQDDARRRPRTLSRLIARPNWLVEKALLCPNDPGLRTPPANLKPSEWRLWGNQVNATQEPMRFLDQNQKYPEAGSWEAELREITETNRFSYLHVFTWQLPAYKRLGTGNQAGNAVCQLHGLRLSTSSQGASYTDFEGWTLRAQRDGAVVSRKIFRSRGQKEGIGVNGDTITVALNREEYPWEFYVDTAPP